MTRHEARFQHPPFPESIPEVILRKKMFEQKGVYFLDQPDLDVVMRESVMHFEDEVQQIKAGKKSPAAMRKYLFSVEGVLGSGKTRTSNDLLLPYLKTASKRMEIKYNIDVQVCYLQWDNVEDALITEKVINPERGKPFSPQELMIVGSFLKLLTAYALGEEEEVPRDDIQRLLIESNLITPTGDQTEPQLLDRLTLVFKNLLENEKFGLQKKSPYRMVVVEKNTATAIKTKNGTPGKKRLWTPVTRQYAPDMIDDLHYQEPPFANIPRDSFYSTAIGCIGGPSMEVLIRSRAILDQLTLDEANALYALLGLGKLHEEQKRIAGYGGSMEQIAASRVQIWPQLLRLGTDANNVDDIVGMLPTYIQDVISLRYHDSPGFPPSALTDTEGRERVQQAIFYSKLFEPKDRYKQWHVALELFEAACFREAEAALILNNFGGEYKDEGTDTDVDKDKKVNRRTVVFNNPILQVPKEAWGIFAKRS